VRFLSWGCELLRCLLSCSDRKNAKRKTAHEQL